MSTKSAQKPTVPPFQARKGVILFTVIILLVAALAWTMLYTRMAATTPLGGHAPVISPTEVAH